MNKTGKPIDTNKHFLLMKCYNLTRYIDSLPPSSEATSLVVKASDLMDDIWNYVELHQPKMRLDDFIRESLEARYKGKKIKNPYANVEFVVDYVEVTPDGPDPQMNVILASNKYKEAVRIYQTWIQTNNTTARRIPENILKIWNAAQGECFMMCQINSNLPEIVGESESI